MPLQTGQVFALWDQHWCTELHFGDVGHSNNQY